MIKMLNFILCKFCHNKIKGGWCWEGPIVDSGNSRYKYLLGRGSMGERKANRTGVSKFGGCCMAQDEAEAISHWNYMLICVLRLVGGCEGLSSGEWHNLCLKKSPWTRVESVWRGSECGWPVGKVLEFSRREMSATLTGFGVQMERSR